MNRTGKDLFAGAALAQKKDSGLTVRGLLRNLCCLIHLGTLAWHQIITPIGFFGEDTYAFSEAFSFQGLSDRDLKVLRIERFWNKIVSALLHRLDGPFDGTVRGNNDDRYINPVTP